MRENKFAFNPRYWFPMLFFPSSLRLSFSRAVHTWVNLLVFVLFHFISHRHRHCGSWCRLSSSSNTVNVEWIKKSAWSCSSNDWLRFVSNVSTAHSYCTRYTTRHIVVVIVDSVSLRSHHRLNESKRVNRMKWQKWNIEWQGSANRSLSMFF